MFCRNFACFVCTFAKSQTCDFTLSGTVVDVHTNEPIPYAKIFVQNSSSKIVVDSLGNFQLNSLCAGIVRLRCIPHLGCEPVDTSVVISGNTVLILRAETHTLELDEFVVEAFRFRKESEARFTLNANDLSIIKGATLGEQLVRIPGVTTLNTGSSIVKPVINGLHSNRLVIVNNGIRQEGQQWGSEHAPEIDPNLASKLEVVQGASSLKYGPDAIGGVVIVSPEDLRYKKSHEGWLKLAGNSNGIGAMTSGLIAGSLLKSGNLAYRVHGTWRLNGTQKTPDYFIKNTALNESSFSGAIGYQTKRIELNGFYSRFTTNLGIFTGSHIGNLTDLNAAFQSEQPKDSGFFTYQLENPKQHIQHQLSKLEATVTWNKQLKTSFTYGYQFNLRQEYDLHKGYNDSIAALDLPAFELNLWTNTFESQTEIIHSSRLKSVVGISGLEQSNAYSGRFFIPNFKKKQLGIYYTGVYETVLWLLDYGLRYDYSQLSVFTYEDDVLVNPKRNFGNTSASIGVSRIFGHHWISKLTLGTAWRPPSINELYSNGLHHGAASIEIGDQQLNKELAYSSQVSVQYKSRIARMEMNAFYTYFDGYINLQPSFPPLLTIVGAFPVFNYRQSTVQIYGVNGQLEVPIKKRFIYQIQGNILLADDLDNSQPVFGIPSNRLTQRLRFSSKLTSKSKWDFFAEIEGMNVFQQKRYTTNSDYVSPPSAYFLLAAQLGVSKKRGEEQSVQFILSCSNLTNTVYRDYMNRFRYFTNDLGRNWNIKMLLPFNFKQSKK